MPHSPRVAAALLLSLTSIACSDPAAEEPARHITLIDPMEGDLSDMAAAAADANPDDMPPDAAAPEPDLLTNDDGMSPDLTDMPPEPSRCADHGLPERLAVTMGERVTLPLPDAGRYEVRYERVLLPIATLWQTAEGLTLRPHYKGGEHLLALSITCAEGEEVVHELTLEVSSPQMRTLSDWGTAGPSTREHAPIFTHPEDESGLYLFGGYAYRPRQFTVVTDLWRLDHETLTWSPVETSGETPPFAGGRMVWSASRAAHLFVGGAAPLSGAENHAVYELRRDAGGAWSWQELVVEGALTHNLGAVVWDEVHARLLLVLGVGGLNVQNSQLLQQAYELRLNDDAAPLTWRAITAQGSPTPRYGFAHLVDPSSRRLVVFGGAQGFSPLRPAQDTWALDLDTLRWSELAVSNVGNPFVNGELPPGGRNPCWAHDPVHQRLFVWGGTSNGNITDTGLYALHLDGDGAQRWFRVVLEGAPAPRASCSGGRIAASSELVFGFGNSERGVYQDLWLIKTSAP